MPISFVIMIAAVVLLAIIVLFVRKRKMCAQKSVQHYPESEQLYVGNLSYQINTHHLKEIFSQYGDVQSVRLIKNARTGRSKGFAFVTFVNTKSAKKALAMNGVDIHGRVAVVRMAKPRDES